VTAFLEVSVGFRYSMRRVACGIVMLLCACGPEKLSVAYTQLGECLTWDTGDGPRPTPIVIFHLDSVWNTAATTTSWSPEHLYIDFGEQRNRPQSLGFPSHTGLPIIGDPIPPGDVRRYTNNIYGYYLVRLPGATAQDLPTESFFFNYEPPSGQSLTLIRESHHQPQYFEACDRQRLMTF
jgi:hypothetical protein